MIKAPSCFCEGSGSSFDPEVVAAFMRAEKQILAVFDRLQEAAADKTQPAAPPPARLPQPNGRVILIVEDDEIAREQLQAILDATGHKIVAAADGVEGLNLIQQQTPDVVICDWMMPRMDGVQLCQAVRARYPSELIHFIMLTANSDKGRLLQAYQAGADDFVSKPFDPEELLARVRAGIRSLAIHKELLQKAEAQISTNAQLAMLNSRLERLSITDELTGVFNRRHAMVRLEDQ